MQYTPKPQPLVPEHRSLQNFLTKWLQSDWVLAALVEQQQQRQRQNANTTAAAATAGAGAAAEDDPVRVWVRVCRSWKHAGIALTWP